MAGETLLSCFRCILIAVAATGLASLVARTLHERRGRFINTTLVALLVLPLLTPSLLTAYAYTRWALPLIHQPAAKEALYSTLVFLKWAPLAMLITWLFPPAVSAISAYTFRLSKPSRWLVLKFRLRHFAGAPALAFAAVFFFAFHEFELASLLGIETWPVQLFDAHAGGVDWTETLKLAAPPLIVQCTFVVMLGLLLTSLPSTVTDADFSIRQLSSFGRGIAWAAALLSGGAITLFPLGMIAPQALVGLPDALRSFSLVREVLASALFGVTGGLTAWAASRRFTGKGAFAAALPGLLGPLAVALLTLRLFQFGPAGLYDSPLPLLFALTAVFLPLALLLQRLFVRARTGTGVFLTQASPSWRPAWVAGAGRIQFFAIAILILAAWCELSATAILAPPGMTTASIRLHNLMHYGQSHALSSMAVISFSVPFLLIIILYSGIHWAIAIHDRGLHGWSMERPHPTGR
jgi:ABC-type Fe3+ transport system permease subunit